ncbi:MAG: DNA-processing protein DprA [Myxococcota bacterium]
MQTAFFDEEPVGVISPAREITAYEHLWKLHGTVKRMADLFREHEHVLPSEVADRLGIASEELTETESKLVSLMSFDKYTAFFFRDFEYPAGLRDAKHPVEVLYTRGEHSLLSSRSVSIVGTRTPTDIGIKRARKVARILVDAGITVMSGLASGIDTAAHQATLEQGGATIAVMGTSLAETYPRENLPLRRQIEARHLVVSPVPFALSASRTWVANRAFFPERNKTMSALSSATIIVEAGKTRGTLTQAKAAVQQNRKLLILGSCFESGLDWPQEFLGKGAVRIGSDSELIDALEL